MGLTGLDHASSSPTATHILARRGSYSSTPSVSSSPAPDRPCDCHHHRIHIKDRPEWRVKTTAVNS